MSDSVREAAANYLRFARENPALAGDAKALGRLEDAIFCSLDEGFVTRTAPNSPWTWEVRAQLLNTDTDSQRVSFEFPFTVNVVGFYPTIVAIRPLATVPAGIAIPTLDDIDCSVDINNSAVLTNSQGVTTVTGRGGNGYVTLSSLAIQASRTMGIRLLGDSKPNLGFTFRWKQPAPATGVIWQSVLVSLAIYAYDATRGIGNQTNKGIRGT